MMVMSVLLTSIVLIYFGYVYACCYLNNVEFTFKNTNVLKLTKNKIFYIISAFLTTIVLLCMFQFVYKLDWLTAIRLISLSMILFPIGVIDLRTMKIPNHILLFAIVLRILLFAIEMTINTEGAMSAVVECTIATLIFIIFFLLIAIVFKSSVGMGDIKLFGVLGFYQGLWGGVNSIFFSLMVSFVLSVGFLITKKKNRNDAIPFAPFILMGTIIAMAMSGM